DISFHLFAYLLFDGFREELGAVRQPPRSSRGSLYFNIASQTFCFCGDKLKRPSDSGSANR
ncbi:MAG: hypothetical protein ACFFB7_09315, partial [Candidatus Sifarchaeia archaeon]